MYALSSSPTVIPFYHTRKSKVNQLLFKSHNYTQHPPIPVGKIMSPVSRKKSRIISAVTSSNSGDVLEGFDGEDTINIDMTELKDDDGSSPWEGAIIYQRNASITHLEYCTTLERLGLAKVSSEKSKAKAFTMGIRVNKTVKDFPLGTPVLVSIDVTRKKKRLRLDGIIKTVITLDCNRCGEPTGEGKFSNFSILLLEDPIEDEEDNIKNIETILGGNKSKSYTQNSIETEDEDDKSIDKDDRLHFPREEKSVDISKNIRDLIHIEIAMTAVCSPECKGVCLQCFQNLNTSNCNCDQKVTNKKVYGPLGDLKARMQQN